MQTVLDTSVIKAEALRLGFSACGVSPAAPVEEMVAKRFVDWIHEGKQADMAYMANYTDKRLNPALLMEGAKTIISVALNYYPQQLLDASTQYEFAWYAYGKDYHVVMKNKLQALLDYIHMLIPTVNARVFCDTAPVLERYWAWRSGVGWIGKNTQLIIPHKGSTFFLGELLLDVPFTTYDNPVESRCGSCTRCLDNCPAKALEQPYTLNSARCLSYLTIEHRGDIPAKYAKKMGNCVYGCDRCQSVCPWNRFAYPNRESELAASSEFMNLTRSQLEGLTVEQYRTVFKGSAVKRTKYEGLMRNVCCVAAKSAKKEE